MVLSKEKEIIFDDNQKVETICYSMQSFLIYNDFNIFYDVFFIWIYIRIQKEKIFVKGFVIKGFNLSKKFS